MNKSDLFFSRQNMNLLCRDESCSVYQMKNETGDGTATYYEVYPGIGVMYNDFHMILRPAILCWTVLPRKTTIAAFP